MSVYDTIDSINVRTDLERYIQRCLAVYAAFGRSDLERGLKIIDSYLKMKIDIIELSPFSTLAKKYKKCFKIYINVDDHKNLKASDWLGRVSFYGTSDHRILPSRLHAKAFNISKNRHSLIACYQGCISGLRKENHFLQEVVAPNID